MSYSASRLTIFAILSALEDDFRNLIISELGDKGPMSIFGDKLLAKTMERYLKENQFSLSVPNVRELSFFLDFADAFTIINQHRAELPKDIAECIQTVTPRLEQLIPVRNRVAHVRPLQYDDLANVLDTCDELLKVSLPWGALRSTLKRIDVDPSFVLALRMPELEDSRNSRHNLPLPDFDETGFVGRRVELQAVKKLVMGAFPVISLVGEGGLGKTALALKAAYDILDEHPGRFDAIVWSTSKTSQLTASEIRKIEGAITTSLGVLHDVAVHLAGDSSFGDAAAEIHQYLEEFKVLIILDNMENVLDDNVRSFLEGLPSGSKILITSRVGLGAFEAPFRLGPLQQSEAVQLLRATAKVHGCSQLTSLPAEVLQRYCQQMHSSPGFIKWFVSAVTVGKRPEEVLANPELFLEFCMRNVYENLQVESKRVLAAMLSVPGFHSQAELSFLCNFEAARVQRALQQLLSSNIVNMSSERDGALSTTKYFLADLPRSYLMKHHKPTPEEDQAFSKSRQSLLAAAERMMSEKTRNPFSSLSIKVRSKSDFVVARFLRAAVQATLEGHLERAEKSLEYARQLAPEYYEVFRVEAQLRIRQENHPAAREAFEAAIELESKSVPVLYWYGKFLLSEAGDTESAKKYLLAARAADKRNPEIAIELCRAHLYLREFDRVSELLQEMRTSHIHEDVGARFADIEVQLHYRIADHAVDREDFKTALSQLKLMKEKYLENVKFSGDAYYREKLRKSVSAAVRCSKGLHLPSEQEEIVEIIRWMDSLAYSTTGTLDSLDASADDTLPAIIDKICNGGFGFLRMQDGSQMFFHKSVVQPKTILELSLVGREVRCRVGISPKGPAASIVLLQ